jgi:Ca2+/Na+ antiporter
MHHPHATVMALTSTQNHLWWGAIIGGFVIVLAVAALLTILVVLVRTIDQRVVKVRDTLKEAVATTNDTALIGTVAGGVEAVLAEGLEHHLFLGRVLSKVRT